MEFERALFRIHQRALLSEHVRKVRLSLERCLPWIIVPLVILLCVLHVEYVGQAECLPRALRQLGYWNATEQRASLPDDVVLGLYVVDEPDPFHATVDDFLDMEISMTTTGGSASPRRRNHTGSTGSGLTVMDVTNRSLVSSPAPDPKKVLLAYKFAFDREVISMRQALFHAHNFKVLNVSISGRCLAPAWRLRGVFFLLDSIFEALLDADCIILNELAYTFRSRGFMDRYIGDEKVESWAWSSEQVETFMPSAGRSLFTALARKIVILAKSIVTFMLISSMTGLFIRVAVNGSAVVMFPIAIFVQSHRASGLSLGGLIRSFPWIGVHLEVLRRSGRSLTAFFRSHLVFFLLMSFAYLACNLAWRFILYRKSTPEGFEESVFSFCSMLELFNLIFVRSINSTVVFPKVAFASLVYLHFYVFCSLYPFHSLAYSICVGICTFVAVYCLNHYEEPALHADPFAFTTPTAAHPRALYMPQLSPSWTLEAAPLWTMFYVPEHPSTYTPDAMRQISNEEYLMP